MLGNAGFLSFFFFFKQKKKQWLGNELHKYLRSPGLHFLLKCSLLFPKRLMLAIPKGGGVRSQIKTKWKRLNQSVNLLELGLSVGSLLMPPCHQD